MMNPFPLTLRAVLPSLLALLLLASPALACGFPIGAGIDAEQALIIQDGTTQQMVLSVNLLRTQPDAAVIFPVPAKPEVRLAPENIFTYLREATAPRIETKELFVWGVPPPVTGGANRGVTVLGREILGGYDVARLAASDATALQQWLSDNGFTIPAAATRVLDSYIADNWAFVAVRLAPGSDGALAPLLVQYTAENITYPLRLGSLADAPFDVELYVAASGRVTTPDMETAYAGPTASLSTSPDISPLLTAPYLTKLERRYLPGQLPNDDARITLTGDDTPYQRVITQTVYLNIWEHFRREIILIGVLLVLSLSLIPIGYYLRQRLLSQVGDDD